MSGMDSPHPPVRHLTPPLSAESSSREDHQGNNGVDDESRLPGFSLLDLPSDLHIQLMLSCLDYRDLEMLRSTNTYFRNLLSGTEIRRIKTEYIKILVTKEKEEVANSPIRDCREHELEFEHEDEDEDTGQYLNCYSCLRCLPFTEFSSTQSSKRRRKGHTDAAKRFCKDCGMKGNRWELGTLLSFPTGRVVYCRQCRQLIRCPNPEWAKLLGMCRSCRLRSEAGGWKHNGISYGDGADHVSYRAKEALDRASDIGRLREARERKLDWLNWTGSCQLSPE
ncbi:hypothetical protein AJ80_06133 [Polytolypa hystricis UAMH7299]|uniref:F-box domain-containing protein n=1 Tax=Polytolypa hystricis (strain UAMH7299) TaxID=1447883 RepID=A0A2B7XYZ0_POLH7|nr:hypothetical protein AJ80_06133 [Polytolypa hystricis UAMH7299]